MLGETIKKKRQDKGLNIRYFARMLEIPPSQLSDIEQNYVESIPYDLLKKIASILGVSFEGMLKIPLVFKEKPKFYKADFICTRESIGVFL
jgi:transcriptional regulator with XRE-family HTH domain